MLTTNNKKTIPIQVDTDDIEIQQLAHSVYDNQQIEKQIVDEDTSTRLTSFVGQTCLWGGLQMMAVGLNIFPLASALGITGLNFIWGLTNISIVDRRIKIQDSERLKIAVMKQVVLTATTAKVYGDNLKTEQQADYSYDIYLGQVRDYEGKPKELPTDWIFAVGLIGILTVGALLTKKYKR